MTVEFKGWAPIGGVVLGVWASLPPYIGPALHTASRVEVVDHVLPGVVIVSASFLAAVFVPRAVAPFAAALVVALAGMWMVMTHVPLIRQALRNEVSNAAAAWHSAPGLVILAFGLVWAAANWSAVAAPATAGSTERS